MFQNMLFLTISVCVILNLANAALYIKDIKFCPESKGTISFADKGLAANGRQKVDVNVNMPEPVDNTALAQVTIYSDVDGAWKQTYQIPKKLKACNALEFFFGTIWHDLQKENGIEPGTCPIQGNFKFSNYEVDTDHIKVPMLPKGLVNITVEVRDKNDQLIACEYYIVTNN